MLLSAELFNQIIAALRSDQQSGEERRVAPRVGLRAEVDVLLRPVPGAPRVLMRCRDLSVGGIGLVYDHALPPGHEFLVRLPAARGQPAVLVSCVTVHSRELDEKLFAIGARVVRTLSTAEAALLGSFGA
jgi:hypothetical protein